MLFLSLQAVATAPLSPLTLIYLFSLYITRYSEGIRKKEKIRPHNNMAGGIVVEGTADVGRVEAPVTVKAYLICAFAAFGGIFFGYDTGETSPTRNLLSDPLSPGN